ncbi:hypothetical protein ASD15_28000 [Massilia sp. Root351]|jgi:hypothetical protein|uniref:hypothetical protein n=1 Tax=Massilia sp. Root351 TaxID=1736522 RepID=UPI00070C7B77|nr:hypothetical protein [Massilia sp. Root351]KQV87893.1 hypothetical protein ASD15_28000 [Massilia sp. Root351]
MAGAWYELLLAVLAVWRVTHLLHAEDGPWDAVARLRGWAGDGVLGRAMDCFYCASLWVALPAAAMLSSSWQHFALLWPALSAAAITLERVRGALRQEEN